jgi:hypothetical protein
MSTWELEEHGRNSWPDIKVNRQISLFGESTLTNVCIGKCLHWFTLRLGFAVTGQYASISVN